MSHNIGKENELTTVKHYEKMGYHVLRVNDEGFPDLLLLKDRQLIGFVEVKGGSHKVHDSQQIYHEKLRKLGFKVDIYRID